MKDVKFTPIHDNAKSKTANPIINIPNNCIKLELCSFTFAFTFVVTFALSFTYAFAFTFACVFTYTIAFTFAFEFASLSLLLVF